MAHKIEGHRFKLALTAEQAKEVAIDGAISNLLKHGQALPVLIVVTETFYDVILLPMTDEQDKAMLEKFIPHVIKETNAKAAVFVSEGWTKDPKTMERTGEALLVIISTPERTEVKTIEIKRNQDGKPELGKEENAVGAFCRWFDHAWGTPTAH